MTRHEHAHHHARTTVPPVSRRSFLIGAAAAPVLAWGAEPAASAVFGVSPATAAAVTAHPSMLHTASDLTRARDRVASSLQPWKSGWDRLVANGRSQSTWTARPLETVIRGGDGSNYAQLYPDIHAAYQNALRWRLSGSAAHGNTAVAILNAWSGTLRTVTGNADRFLAAGIYGYQFANAAELVRDHPGFDRTRFRNMLLNIFHPLNEQFLTNHNGAVITNYWANWDLCNMASILAIGIFADRDDLVARAIDYFETGAGNGSIEHAIPYVYESEGLAQFQESGRDQGHTVLGMGLLGAFCEMAWNQGVDCYGYGGNRFLKAAEYVAKYNLGFDVPFTDYTWQSGPSTTAPHVGWATHTEVSSAGRGHIRPVWESILGHYEGRRGISAPWVRQMAESIRPDGGGGDYGTASGGYDQLGFGTLLHAPAATGINRLQSYNFPDRYIRHANNVGRIDPNVSPAADAQFRLRRGLVPGSSGRVSFESVNFPGYYLRHYAYEIRLERHDGSATFAADATFQQVASPLSSAHVMFRSHNYPDRYLRHLNYVLRVDPLSSDQVRADASFRVVA
ncbi:AbfB domain-containing protein [Antribacter sp. KLBMP9083]|uniref:AbfB domain-containing protein n=1 Tax=Antribacter soli TaxID=2910976 RepID=A0AA41QD70_9MICO|nr:AbfB domain-containing protein [Antribacter soli]MCF4120982.1 AbfB domain-containing protein [Antribacter soli]